MTKNIEGNSIQTKYAVAAFCSVLIFVITYKYALTQLDLNTVNDLVEHTIHARDIYLDRLGTSWLKMPYMFWHLCVKGCIKFFKMPVEAASACTHGFFAGLTCLVTFYFLDCFSTKMTGKDLGVPAALTSAALCLVQPLYVPWFNSSQYLGQFSINPIFNPTHMAVKPFGIICFMLAADLILTCNGKEKIFFAWIQKSCWLYILFSVFLFLSVFTKPTFMYMLLPAGAIYLLIDLGLSVKKGQEQVKKVWGIMWRIACACIPSILYLGLEYAAFYLWGGLSSEGAGVAIYPFLTAWHLFSNNIFRSVRLAMAFPFWMVIICPKYFFRSVEGRLSLICYVTGTLEFSFFVETGSRLTHLNFAWPMMSGMLLFWLVSVSRLIVLTVQPPHKHHRLRLISVLIGWILLAIYMFSGLYFINPYQYII